MGSKSERMNTLQKFRITDDYLEQIQIDSRSIKDIAPSKDATYMKSAGNSIITMNTKTKNKNLPYGLIPNCN